MKYDIQTNSNDLLEARFNIGGVKFIITFKDDEPFFIEMNDTYLDGSDMELLLKNAFFKSPKGSPISLSVCVSQACQLINEMYPSFNPDFKCDEARMEMGAL